MEFLIFSLCAAIVAITSIIMFFHWRKYSVSGGALALTEVIYLSVSAVLLLVAFFSI